MHYNNSKTISLILYKEKLHKYLCWAS